jgi:AcrR family transcriptional regulator
MSDAARLPYGHGRRAILEAAIEVVAESGLRGLTYRAVSARAGVNNSLVAHHFGSRDGLVEAALEYATELTLTAFEASSSEDRPLADDLVERLIGPAAALQMFQYELLLESRRTPSLRPALVRQYDAYIDAWHEMLLRLGLREDRAFARAVAAAVDGLLLQQLTVAEPADVSAAVVRLRALIEPLAGSSDSA